MKKDYSLIFAFVLPLLIIFAAVGSMYYSKGNVQPKYDILYATGGDAYNPFYYVKNGRLQSDFVDEAGNAIVAPESSDGYVRGQKEMTEAEIRNTRFFRYDPDTDASTEIGGFAAAREIPLSGTLTSPDGYSVSERYESGDFFFPFYAGSNGGFSIKGNGGSKRITLGNSQPYNTRMIGWIIE